MNLSIIIPNYNGGRLLDKNIPKLLEAVSVYNSGMVEVIIVDDCSTDNSREIIDNIIKKNKNDSVGIRVVFNNDKKERGFAKNINRGVRVSTGEILILLNTDVVPRSDFIKPLLSHFEESDVFAVGCMDESIENGLKILRGRGVGYFQRGFLTHSRGEVDRNDTLWVSGGSGAFRKIIWEKLGGFDELYNPFYWEDIDLSYRAQKAGYKVFFENRSIVEHMHEEGSIKTKFGKNFVKKIAYRNQFIFMWKNITDINLIISHIFWLPYYFLKMLRDREWQFFEGFFLAVLRIDKISKARRAVRKSFINKDSEIVKKYEELL